ncbi:ComEC/Rec2 family competence protein [Algoriphagus sp. CAU 1675]|uniref:ComEC/Rec2 family competence protein n=1 Tax=Algoriphagus sp. CAU 1675 TaxID=3032597 RepID=UPI0023DC8E3C|nr:ComEC/Rec2 family competence protein [Algoriphagus sp. CAU 1675]MDF2159037.1 ComEC/Rec2 family competence protein [Algoriphagus sp. CAU 1675]
MVLLSINWIAYLLLVLYRKEGFKQFWLPYSQLVLLGILAWQSGFLLTQPYSNEIAYPYIAEVLQYDQEKPNSRENLLEVKFIKKDGTWESAKGKVLLYHRTEAKLKPGQIISIAKAPESVPPPVNPHEFDYRGFLARKGIANRQFVKDELFLLDSNATKTSSFWVENLREKLKGLIQSKVSDRQSQNIALALLLGQKQHLDRDTRKAYSETGVMHVLAVSGLHVGILVGVLILLIKPLSLGRRKKKFYLLGVVLVIWVYAFLTGLSPSVLRASVMFSLIVLGQMRERKPSIFNILAFSAMLMIVIDPEVLFEVGFQLSYLAVLGIVVIQPLILRWWLPPNKVMEYIWQLICVSVAAQLATFPLSVWYFHSFPPYFLMANLVVVPLTFLAMNVGIPFLVLGFVPYLGDALGMVLNFLLKIQFWVLQFIQILPGSRMDGLTIFFPTMLAIWGLLLVWGLWDHFSKKKLIQTAFLFLFVWAAYRLHQELDKPDSALVVYRSQKGWMMDFWNGKSLQSWNEGISNEDIDYLVKPNRIAMGWSGFPGSLKAIEEGDLKLYFPEVGVKLSKSNQILFLDPKIPSQAQVWKDGFWENYARKDSLDFSGSAIRILF